MAASGLSAKVLDDLQLARLASVVNRGKLAADAIPTAKVVTRTVPQLAADLLDLLNTQYRHEITTSTHPVEEAAVVGMKTFLTRVNREEVECTIEELAELLNKKLADVQDATTMKGMIFNKKDVEKVLQSVGNDIVKYALLKDDESKPLLFWQQFREKGMEGTEAFKQKQEALIPSLTVTGLREMLIGP